MVPFEPIQRSLSEKAAELRSSALTAVLDEGPPAMWIGCIRQPKLGRDDIGRNLGR